MNITIHDIKDYDTLANIETILSGFDVRMIMRDNEPEHDEKPLYAHAAEILGHIHNHDYGLAESKAGLLRDQLQKGDWTLGAGIEIDRLDDGCDVIGNSGDSIDIGDRATLLKILEIVNRLAISSIGKDVRAIKAMKSVDRLITEWSAQHDEDTAPIKERTCAFCGRDDPSVLCGGNWFCDGKCANDHVGKDTLIKVRNAYYIGHLEQVIEDLKDKNIDDLHELYDLDKEELDRLKHDLSICEGLGAAKDLIFAATKVELLACKQDSDVLMQVVKIVKVWDDGTGRAFPTLYQLVDLLVDYTETPEERAG